MLRSFLLILAAALTSDAGAAGRVLVGYLATFGDLPVEQVPWGRLTHLCHAYLRLDAEGELVTTPAMPDAALTAAGRKNGVPVLATIGGGATVRGLEKVTADAAATAKLAGEVVRVVVDGKYDGVDLDWESPRNEATRAGHARLVGELRRRLDEQAQESRRPTPYLLTATVTASPALGRWVDTAAVAPKVDWLNVKAYGMSGPWSSHSAHHAPLFAASDDPEKETRSVAAAMRYWEVERGVPKGKLVVGVPMFARAMPAAAMFEPLDPDLARHHRAMAFGAARKLIGEGWVAQWDNESRAPWLSKPKSKTAPEPAATPLTPVDPGAYDGPMLVSYDDRNSVHGKATWARQQGYRGLSFYAIHQDRMADGQHWLLEAAAAAWPAE